MDSIPQYLVVWRNWVGLHIFQNITTDFVLPKSVITPTYRYFLITKKPVIFDLNHNS
jgi:hypothetical protein